MVEFFLSLRNFFGELSAFWGEGVAGIKVPIIPEASLSVISPLLTISRRETLSLSYIQERVTEKIRGLV